MLIHLLMALSIAPGNITGVVSDSSTGQPLPATQVTVLQADQIVATTSTDAFGRYLVHNLPPGRYQVRVRFPGFNPALATATVTSGTSTTVNIRLVPAAIQLSSVEVVGAAEPLAVDTRTGNQVFQQNEFHGAPTNTTSQILQQAIVGAAKAPTGEVHIRGQHAEYTY